MTDVNEARIDKLEKETEALRLRLVQLESTVDDLLNVLARMRDEDERGDRR